MNRSKLREHIFKLLFVREFNSPDEMPEQIRLYFEDIEDLSEKDQNYMEQKLHRVEEHLPEIDSLLNQKSEGWKTSRMSRVDLNILRLAVYEMNYDEDIPVGVAINEAVEMAKRFGQDGSAAFVNGILGSISGKKGE